MCKNNVCAHSWLQIANAGSVGPAWTRVCNNLGGVTLLGPLPLPEGTEPHGQGKMPMIEIPENSASAQGLAHPCSLATGCSSRWCHRHSPCLSPNLPLLLLAGVMS